MFDEPTLAGDWVPGRPVPASGDCTVFASRVTLRSRTDLPVLLQWTQRVQAHLRDADGVLGYAVTTAVDGTMWTVSAWMRRTDLLCFERSPTHLAAKAELRELLMPSVFVLWRWPAQRLPIGWSEVRSRIEAASPDHPAPTSRRRPPRGACPEGLSDSACGS